MAAKKKAAPRKKTARKKKPAATKKAARKKTVAKKARRKPARPAAWGLAVEGDWPRSAFAIGALDRLRKVHGVKEFTVAAGAGAGALVAALVAQDRWTDLVALYAGLDPAEFLRPRYGHLKRKPLLSVFLSGITRTTSLYLPEDALRRLVVESLDEAALMRSPTETHFVVLDLRTGRPRSYCNRTDRFEDMQAALLAAVTRPVVLPPVAIGADRHPCVDGSLRPGATLDACLAAVRRFGGPEADRVLAVSTTHRPADLGGAGRSDLVGVAARAFELVTGDGGERSVREARLVNALVRLREKLGDAALTAALRGADAETRAAVARLAKRQEVPVVHLRPEAAAGRAGAEAWRTAVREGAAAVERAIG